MALVIVAALQATVFLDHHRRRWEALDAAAKKRGEGLFICHNGLGYYAWLRSLLLDGDWSFDNEFDEHALPNDYVPPPSYRTATGRRANHWSVGPACLWSLTIGPVHLATTYFSPSSTSPSLLVGECRGGGGRASDGYSLPYQWTVGLTSLAATFAALGFTLAVCRQVARPSRAALAVVIIWLGTTLVYYGGTEMSSAHGLGAAAMAVLVWYWRTSYGSKRLGRWLLVGILVGFAALMRWQLLTFASLPAGELVFALARPGQGTRREALGEAVRYGIAAALGGIIGFAPQMIAWRCVYGSWLTAPVPGVSWHGMHPSRWAVLFSWDRSLFYWTPCVLLAFLGAAWAACTLVKLPAQNQSFVILFIAFCLQVYAVASLLGRGLFLPHTGNWSGVHLAGCYGFRLLSESLIALAPGFAWALDQLPSRPFRIIAGLSCLLVIWNLQLIVQFEHAMLPQFAGAAPQQLLAKSWNLVRREPWSFFLFAVLGPLMITGLLGMWSESPVSPRPSPSRE